MKHKTHMLISIDVKKHLTKLKSTYDLKKETSEYRENVPQHKNPYMTNIQLPS